MTRLVQYEPIEALDEVFLVPRAGRVDELARRMRELICVAELATIGADVYVPGVNIDGGTVGVGDAITVARIAGGSLEEIVDAANALATLVEPTKLVLRDGATTHAIAIAEAVTVTPIADWAAHLVSDGAADLACELLIADRDDLAAVARAVELCPQAFEPRALLGQLHRHAGRHADAIRELAIALELEAREHEKAWACADLGCVYRALGRHDEAIALLKRAVEARRIAAHSIELGVAYLRAGRFDEAWDALRPFNVGRRLFEMAEILHRLERFGDARAFLRAGLELDPDQLAPVPANQWPKAVDTSWAVRPELAALVDHGRAVATARAAAKAQERAARQAATAAAAATAEEPDGG